MTRDQLVQEAIDRGYNYVKTTRINAACQRAVDKLYARHNWSFLEETIEGEAPLEIADLKKVLTVVDATTGTPLRGVDRRRLAGTVVDLDASGPPVCWYLEGNTLKTYPVSANTIGVRYKKKPAALASNEEPLVPEEWQYLIVDLIVIDLLKDDDEYEEARNLKVGEVEEGIREMRHDLLNRNNQNNSTIVRTGRAGDYLQ